MKSSNQKIVKSKYNCMFQEYSAAGTGKHLHYLLKLYYNFRSRIFTIAVLRINELLYLMDRSVNWFIFKFNEGVLLFFL